MYVIIKIKHFQFFVVIKYNKLTLGYLYRELIYTVLLYLGIDLPS